MLEDGGSAQGYRRGGGAERVRVKKWGCSQSSSCGLGSKR